MKSRYKIYSVKILVGQNLSHFLPTFLPIRYAMLSAFRLIPTNTYTHTHTHTHNHTKTQTHAGQKMFHLINDKVNVSALMNTPCLYKSQSEQVNWGYGIKYWPSRGLRYGPAFSTETSGGPVSMSFMCAIHLKNHFISCSYSRRNFVRIALLLENYWRIDCTATATTKKE